MYSPSNLGQRTLPELRSTDAAYKYLSDTVATVRAKGTLSPDQLELAQFIVERVEVDIEPMKQADSWIEGGILSALKTLKKECPAFATLLNTSDEDGLLYSGTNFLINSSNVLELAESSDNIVPDESSSSDSVVTIGKASANDQFLSLDPSLLLSPPRSVMRNLKSPSALGSARKSRLAQFAYTSDYSDSETSSLGSSFLQDSNLRSLPMSAKTEEMLKGINEIKEQMAELRAEKDLQARVIELESTKSQLEAKVAAYEKSSGGLAMAKVVFIGAVGGGLITYLALKNVPQFTSSGV